MPSWDREKVMKTLMLYMTIRIWTDPRVKMRMQDRGEPHEQDAVLDNEPLARDA